MPLIDPFGREITYLRVSVTDRCNLRCNYCMPPDVQFMPREHLLTFEEIYRFLRVAAPMGIRKVRLTGGEPLARHDFLELVRMIGSIPDIKELALSTNAVLFAPHAQRLKEYGLQRVNISLDTLRPERFQEITGFDRWRQVMDGIEAALNMGLHPVKINCVVVRGVNDDEIEDFVAWSRRDPVHIRFIEYMPVGDVRRLGAREGRFLLKSFAPGLRPSPTSSP
jgi:cyclic pyranopterin phosphate synthase